MLDKILAYLPEYIKIQLREILLDETEEIRLRAGYAPAVVVDGICRSGTGQAVMPRELEQIMQAASRRSIHAVLDQLCKGFITLEGGHRLGVCGTGVPGNDGLKSIREISSLNFRIARQKKGCAYSAARQIYQEPPYANILILSPPGVGKTTYLRDMIRILSAGELGACVRVGVADERGEVAAVWRGEPQMDLGPNADIMSGCPKHLAIEALTRSMNPQIIAVDEITAERDIEAMERAVGCGVSLLATAHARGVEELVKRPLYQKMLGAGCFDTAVVLERKGPVRTYRICTLKNRVC